jgi:hypothetical protein
MLYSAVIVTRLKEVDVPATNDRAGKLHGRSYGDSFEFVLIP